MLKIPVSDSSVQEANDVTAELRTIARSYSFSRAQLSDASARPDSSPWPRAKLARRSVVSHRASEAIRKFLVGSFPSARVLRVRIPNYDFMVVNGNRKIGVKVKTIDGNTKFVSRTRSAIDRAIAGISSGELDEFQLYLVADTSQTAAAAQAALVGQGPGSIEFDVVLGVLDSDGVFTISSILHAVPSSAR